MGARARSGQKTSRQSIEAKAKAVQALGLRREGKSFRVIAEEAGYNSPQAAHDAVKRALAETLREPAEELRTLEIERLDAMLEIPFLNACAGDNFAIDSVLKIMGRRAKLLGLDAPVRSELTGKDGAALTGGTFVVPGIATPEEWVAAATAQQEALVKRAVPDTETTDDAAGDAAESAGA